MANCCNPLKGDDIMGIYLPGEKITIHRTSCPRAISLMSNFGNNIIKTRWTDKHMIQFLGGVLINGHDRAGMMNDLIKAISVQMGLNIRSITIDSDEGMFEGLFKVFLKDTRQMEELMQKLRAVKGVIKVSRADLDEKMK